MKTLFVFCILTIMLGCESNTQVTIKSKPVTKQQPRQNYGPGTTLTPANPLPPPVTKNSGNFMGS